MFRNMEYVYAVYKAGSFSAAAKDLFISQPCLSAMIKKLEMQLGVPIFDRKAKPLCLTEYGIQYISYLEKIQDLEREFEQYLNDVRGLHTGSLSIGANNVFASYILPSLIHKFKTSFPGIQVQMVEGNISYLENALVHGKLDLVLDNCPMNAEQCLKKCIGTEHLLLAAHATVHNAYALASFQLSHDDILSGRHLENNTPILSIHELENTPFIALRSGNDTRFRMEMLFHRAGTTPNIQLEVDQLATAYNIACNGLGLTFVSDTLLYKTSPYPNMFYYKLHSDISNRSIYLYYKRSRYVTLAMQKFIDTAVTTLSHGIHK